MPIEAGSADFRLMSRHFVDAVNSLPERHGFFRGLVPWLGFRQTSVPFHAPVLGGRPKYTFRRSRGLLSKGSRHSAYFHRSVVTVLGFVITAVSFTCGLVVFYRQLFGGQTVGGVTSLMICVHFCGGCQLATIGTLSEYLGVRTGPGHGTAWLCGAVRVRRVVIEPSQKPVDPSTSFPVRLTARDGKSSSRRRHDEPAGETFFVE